MRASLEKKVERAIRLIQSAGRVAKEHGQPLEVAYSGGKDSDVILELTKMSGVEYRAIYKNTTIDPSGTIRHAEEMGAEVMRPREPFFKLIEKHGLHNRFQRFCCGYLKEYKVLDYVVIGVRREESAKRAKAYTEPEICRVYNKKEKARQYLPILDWTADDVSEFIAERGVKCHPLYYDEQGAFHPERRLGCMGCPMTDRIRKEQLRAHPRMVRAYLRSLRKFRESHPDAKTVLAYEDEYAHLVRDIFFWRKTQREWDEMNRDTLLPPPQLQEVLGGLL